jgi:hypothetical protein
MGWSAIKVLRNRQTWPCSTKNYAAADWHLEILTAMDEYISAAEDTWIAASIVLRLTSVRNLTLAEIAEQLGCSRLALTRSIARFKTRVDRF